MYEVFLKQIENRAKPIDILVVGLGFMGFGFLSYAKTLKGIRVPLLLSRRPLEAKDKLEKEGFKAVVENNPGRIKTYAGKGYVCVSSDLSLIKKYENSIVFEATGTIEYGCEVAVRAIQAGKNVITMNPELEVTLGAELKAMADSKGVVITDVVGDQPGSLSHLISKAKLMGFRIRMAGNMKRYMDIHATQKMMAPWAKDKGLAVRQTTSFTDGTKQAIEMNLVGNHFGMGVLKRGMKGPQVKDVKEVLKKFDWDKIPEEGVVDYVIGKTLFPGVFLVVEHKDSHQQKYLRYLGLGDGPQYVLFEPYHLCHLEVIQTIAKVVLFKEATINNRHNMLRTYAVAKRALKKGEKLDGIGGDTVYGMIDNAHSCENYLPVGFAKNAIIKEDIDMDAPIKSTDAILPLNQATLLSGLVKTQQKNSFFSMIFGRGMHLF